MPPPSPLKIVIPGGSGHLGTVLARHFHATGHDVLVLSRSPRPAPWPMAAWDGVSADALLPHLEGADVLLNLVGRSVNCRYTPANRREIIDSRVRSTLAIGEAIARVARPPRVWLQSSTATIYAHRYDAANDEATGIIGGKEPGVPETWRFSIEVARAWERAAAENIGASRTRQVLLRTAIVMARGDGGPFALLHRLVKLGLGGASGDGRQYVSWIHEMDFIRAIELLIAGETWSGVVNLAAPNPLPNADFMRDLRAAAGVPIGLPSPAWLLEIGAVFLRTETELILKSRRVIPGRLAAAGFTFQYPDWPSAAQELCARA